MAWKSKGSALPPSSVQLLVPPVRLMSALVWKVVQQRSVMQYDMVLDFIGLATEMLPDLLSPSQKAQLVLGLRARLVLELCRGDGIANLSIIQNHLNKIHTFSAELSSSEQMADADILKTSYSNFASLIQNILNVPFEKEFFFQEVFPTNYGSAYSKRIEQLVSVFLSRLEQLLPIPSMQQTAAWIDETSVSEDFKQHLSEPFALKTLLLHHNQPGILNSVDQGSSEDIILSTLALPSQTAVGRFAEVYSEGDDDYDNAGICLILGGSEEESSRSLEANEGDWVAKKKSGPLSQLFFCPQCSFTHRTKRKVQEHILSVHRTATAGHKKKALKQNRIRSEGKIQDPCAEKKKEDGDSEKQRKRKDGKTKKRRRRKEPTGNDRRFLTTRVVSKNFTEEETKCPTCEKIFEHPNQMKTHLKIHSFRYHCIVCEKGFTSQSGYYQHQRLHKKGRRFICTICNKGFLCNYSLKQHQRLHGGPRHPCNICGKHFSKAGIIRHIQMHKGERNYLCTTCGSSFLSSGELVLHNRVHTGETPYTCVHCGKGFASKSHLNVHTRSHTGERPYLCTECPKRFLTLNCLKRHTLSHNGVKPFKCSHCDREFSQQGNLKRHMATHKTEGL
ncbi:zinc finger protein 583-like [Gouania willdenowi]|uniref:Zinc finger protein 583-like n=1 Tax=Gouania willdenowi TaxID=441366 RepID=A0A8C5HIZ0_GOUWI|nr:zinc finger protein 583-like [Gouania willdenowi]